MLIGTKCGAVVTYISWSEIGFCDVLWGCWLGGGVLSDPVCKLSAEVELDESPAVSRGAVLAVGSGEGKGDDLCGDGGESISGSSCGG